MGDWKSSFKVWKEEKKRQDEERERQQNASAGSWEQKEYQRKLQKLQNDFRCRIRDCKVVASGPSEYWDLEFSGSAIQSWNKPENLEECYDCRKYACNDHYDRDSNLCMDCAQRRMKRR